MKFTAVIAPELLKTLGTNEACESKLTEVLDEALRPTLFPPNQEQSIQVALDEDQIVRVELDLLQRDAEVIKDMIYEALIIFFDSEYDSDVEVDINNEL